MKEHLVLTSSLGTFTFQRGTILSHAKLIRDTVTAKNGGGYYGRSQVAGQDPYDGRGRFFCEIDGRAGQVPFDLDRTRKAS